MIKRFILVSMALILGLGLVSCKLPDNLANNTNEQTGTVIFKKNNDDIMDKGPVKGGSVKLFSTKPDTLNPILTNNLNVKDFCSLIFENLVNFDRSQKPVPGLAKSWSVSNDGLTWTFIVRENVFWQDSVPFSAEDVEFTLETILNPGVTSVYKSNLQNITTFAAVDKNTLRITLKKPDSFTADRMNIPVIPKHRYSGEDVVKSAKNMAPVGTGPYKFQSYDQNAVLKLIANENWWNAKNQDKNLPDFPYLAEVEVKIFDSSKEAVNAFQTGEIDVAAVSTGESNKYRGRTDLSLKRYLGNEFEFVTLNLSKPALADKAVRQAMAYGVDRLKIINDLLPGEAVVSDVALMPGTWLNDSNTMVYSHDKDKALEILAQNGWKMDRSGVQYKVINGSYASLNFELLVNEDNEIRSKIAEKLREQLGEIGIKVQVRKVAWEDELKSLNNRRYDMALLGCTISVPSDIFNLYASSSSLLQGAGSSVPNISGYNNPLVDSYFNEVLNVTDLSRKKSIFSAAKDAINLDVPYIGLHFYNKSALYNKKIRGDVSPYLWSKLNDLTKWYIPIK